VEAAGKPFCTFAILRRTESRWFARPGDQLGAPYRSYERPIHRERVFIGVLRCSNTGKFMNSSLTTPTSGALVLADRLADWSSMARGAFSANTIRAWRADWAFFAESCRAHRLESMPASPKTVREFVFECLSKNKKPATIRRYVSTIGRAHRASGVLDPTSSEEVKLALKEMGRKAPARQKQARGLTWAEIELFLSVEPRNLRDIRDRALVAVAYDSMCRREELVSLLVEDIEEGSDGSGSLL
jgi:integrase